MKLDGRVALVTGGARRVGRAIVERLAADGCRVAIHYHQSAKTAETLVCDCRQTGADAAALRADLADPHAAAGLVQQVLDRWDRLDLLVNNASVFEPMSLDTFDVQRWQRDLNINLTAPMVVAHAARVPLTAAGGLVVNLCDAATSRPWPDYLSYIVSKGGLETLTRVLARAMAPRVRVAGIAPGVAAWPEDYDEAQKTRLTARIPLGRAGRVEDIAAAVHFLATEGDYTTGTILTIDGGRSVV